MQEREKDLISYDRARHHRDPHKGEKINTKYSIVLLFSLASLSSWYLKQKSKVLSSFKVTGFYGKR
jgi:hypothetical protein